MNTNKFIKTKTCIEKNNNKLFQKSFVKNFKRQRTGKPFTTRWTTIR